MQERGLWGYWWKLEVKTFGHWSLAGFQLRSIGMIRGVKSEKNYETPDPSFDERYVTVCPCMYNYLSKEV